MALTLTGPKVYYTSNNTRIGDNQAQFSLSLFFRFEPGGVPSAAVSPFLVARAFYASFYMQLTGAGTRPGTVKLTMALVGASGASVRHFTQVSTGSVHHLALIWAPGVQTACVDGQLAAFGSMAGNTYSNNRYFQVGGWDPAPSSSSIYTIGDVAAWNGYALSAQDVTDLRDGAKTPDQVGGSASWRGRWTLAGPAGQPAALGDAGLANAFGDPAYNLVNTSGTGTGVYADTLVWTPAAEAREVYVGTSGKTVGCTFLVPSTGLDALPLSVSAYPTVSVNGVPAGSLRDAYITGTSRAALFRLPAGVQVVPGDAVTLSAPAGWLTADAGLAAGLNELPAANHAGESCFGTAQLSRTLQAGLNFSGEGTGHDCIYNLPTNWRYRLGSFVNATADATGKLVSMAGTTSQAKLWDVTGANGIDNTRHPGPTGLFAVGWDDLDPAHPTDFWLSTTDNNTATTLVTERADLANPGSGGVGKVRVFDVQRNPASGMASTQLSLWVGQAQRTPQFDNLVIYGPGDFAYQASTPTVLDRDPAVQLRPCATARDRLGASPGTLRWMDTLTGYAGSRPQAEPEHTLRLSDWYWGYGNDKVSRTLNYVQARPYDTAVSPYFYSPIAGSRYPATLAAPVDAVATALTISDAATAPVIVGLRLYADSEIMRVLGVSGTTVTVERGVENTTAAPHAAGAIQVGHRFPAMTPAQLSTGNGLVAEFVTQAPHGLYSGVPVRFTGTWPTLAWSDGTQTTPPNFAAVAWVTGPSSFAFGIYANNAAPANLSTTYALDPANCRTSYAVGGPQLPIEYAALLTGGLTGTELHLNVSAVATDAAADDLARRARDSYPEGRPLWVELSNEPWNNAFAQWRFYKPLSAALYPGQHYYASLLQRSKQVWQRFRDRFDEGGRNRGGEIRAVVNVFAPNASDTTAILSYAAAQVPPIKVDAIAIAPYMNAPNDTATRTALGVYDNEQALDLYGHWLYHETGSTGWTPAFQAHRAAIAAYNAATGFDCKLIGYEGGIETLLPYTVANFKERQRDMAASPLMHVLQQDIYALCQKYGFFRYSEFCYAYLHYQIANGNYAAWGHYHGAFQDHGKGDGTDGKLDNRLCLATPGQPNTKASTTNQDLHTVSVRGQAWLDWNSGFNSSAVAPVGALGAPAAAPAASVLSEVRLPGLILSGAASLAPAGPAGDAALQAEALAAPGAQPAFALSTTALAAPGALGGAAAAAPLVATDLTHRPLPLAARQAMANLDVAAVSTLRVQFIRKQRLGE